MSWELCHGVVGSANNLRQQALANMCLRHDIANTITMELSENLDGSHLVQIISRAGEMVCAAALVLTLLSFFN